MAINQDTVIGLSILYANRGVSASDLEWWASPAAANITYNQAVVLFATSTAAKSTYPFLNSPNVASPTQYVQQIFANAYGIAAADIAPAELAYWVNWLSLPDTNGIPNYQELPSVINQYQPTTVQAALVNRANVAKDFAQKMLDQANISSFNETQYGTSSSIINTVTKNPATVVAANALVNQAVAFYGASNGQTVALTPATDIFNGTSLNDTFIGANGFVQASDQLNGGGGSDTFAYYTADVTATALPSLADVETVQLIGSTDNVGFDFSSAIGLQTVTFVSPAITNTKVSAALPNGVALGIENSATVTDVTGTYAPTATTATFQVTNVPTLTTVNLNGAKIATLNINAKGGNTLTTLATDSKAIKTVNISSDKSLTVDTLLTDANLVASSALNASGAGSVKVTNILGDKLTTINASKLDGGLNIKAGNGDVTFTGGKGADTIEFAKGKFTTKDILNGGDGKDKLVLNDSDLTPLIPAINAVTNFDTLGLVLDGTDSKIDATKITAFKGYEFSGKASKIDVAGVTPDNTFTLVGLDNTGKDFTLVANDQKAATSTNLVLQDKSTLDNLTFTAFSSSTINVASQLGTLKSTDANTLNVKANSTPSDVKFVVSGNQDLTLNATNATATQIGVTIDASSFVGKLTATGATGAPNIPGNTLTGGKAADTITGGNGSDRITGNDGADILTGGGTGVQGDTDTFVYLNVANSNAGSLSAPLSFDTITDFKNSITAQDVINAKAAGWSASQFKGQAIIDPTVTTLSAAVQSASEQIKASNLGFFVFQANTYVLGTDADITKANAGDLLVQVNGVQNLTAVNFTA